MAQSLIGQHPELAELAHKEWLLTNGIGGFASSSICGMNTRRYHGLLIASLDPPTERRVLVSRIEETVAMEDEVFQLATNQYPGTIEPRGYQYFNEFSREPFPLITFRFEEGGLAKEMCMPYGSNTTIIRYTNLSPKRIRLDLRPHLVDRDYHSLFSESDEAVFKIKHAPNKLSYYALEDSAPVFIGFSKGEFQEDRNWYQQVSYFREEYRGQDFLEDTFQPGFIKLELQANETCYLILTLDEEILDKNPLSLIDAEKERLAQLVPKHISHPFVKDLIVSADQFVVQRNSTASKTILAGYPWFTDWGRDSMIAMRGLAIDLNKQELARSILETFLKYEDEGMLPNRFPDNGALPEYNTIDASLWLFVVLYEYVEKFQDWDFIQKIYPTLTKMIQAHIAGTRYEIHLQEKGFLYGGNPSTQLTWMDARIGDHAFTPRWGCPVEINALWYNALKAFEYFSDILNIPANAVTNISRKFKRNFKSYFLNEKGYLNDTLVPDEWADDSFRPNQLYVLSLPFKLLNKKESLSILQQIEAKLFTPYGMRTLEPTHPDFKPIYKDDQWKRDGAYHQGTVWPFLLGEFYEAKFQLQGQNKKTQREIEQSIEILADHFYQDTCIQGMSEIFDGKEPTTGRGTIHQAWSVSAILSIILRYDLFT